MTIIYVKFHAIFQQKGGHINLFFLLKWDKNFVFGFLCLIKPDSDRTTSLEPKPKNGVFI